MSLSSGNSADLWMMVPRSSGNNVTAGNDIAAAAAASAPVKNGPATARMRVAYQGVPGAYSEAAAHVAYHGCETVPCDQFEQAFQAVERWTADRAVLPIENSLGGSIHRNYDLLLRHRLHIVGEVLLGIDHCLMALPGVELSGIRRVLSHPQALAQTENYLSTLKVSREAVDDTAGAAQIIAREGLADAAAVASSRAAELYKLNILARSIQDDDANVTRFIALAREPIYPPPGALCKTSIVFSLGEGPGLLFKALSVFALRDINLTKIESRPLRSQPLRQQEGDDLVGAGGRQFDYLFYVDFAASMGETSAQNALRHLGEIAPFLRVLGSYAMAE